MADHLSKAAGTRDTTASMRTTRESDRAGGQRDVIVNDRYADQRRRGRYPIHEYLVDGRFSVGSRQSAFAAACSGAATAAWRAAIRRFRDRPGVGPYSFFELPGAAPACFAAVAGSSVASVSSVNFSYSQSMRMLSMPAMPPSAYDADTLKLSTG